MPPILPRPRPRALAAAAALLALAGIAAWLGAPSPERVRAWADAAGAWFPLAFFAAYVAITQFPVPRTVLTLSAGLLFGPVAGTALAIAATGASAALSLILVRALARDWVRERVSGPLVAEVDRRLRARGWLAVGSLRLIAGVPFSLLNYACALTAIRLGPFVAATVVGSAPGTAAGVAFGDALTGGVDPRLWAAAAALVALGVAGLVLEARLPVPEVPGPDPAVKPEG